MGILSKLGGAVKEGLRKGAVNGLLNIDMFNKLENHIDSLVNEIISEIPIKGLENSINKNLIKKKETKQKILNKRG